MGSSAGGHLAGMTAAWESAGDPGSADPVERVSSRPDFVILCYPVVTMEGAYAHKLSRDNLLGTSPDGALVRQLSLEKRITPDYPPVFLWHTLEDRTVDPENSRMLAAELERNHVPYRARFYPHGPHGLGLPAGAAAERYPAVARWMDEMLDFLGTQRILEAE